MKKDTKAIGKIATPKPLTKEESMERDLKQKRREIKIARMRANVIKKQIVGAYEILENIRFDFLSDTMFRDYIVSAKRQLEGAISDYLLSDTYWKEKIEEYNKMTLKDYKKMVANWDKQPTQRNA